MNSLRIYCQVVKSWFKNLLFSNLLHIDVRAPRPSTPPALESRRLCLEKFGVFFSLFSTPWILGICVCKVAVFMLSIPRWTKKEGAKHFQTASESVPVLTCRRSKFILRSCLKTFILLFLPVIHNLIHGFYVRNCFFFLIFHPYGSISCRLQPNRSHVTL